MQDRANVSADFLDLMKQEIIDVIKKYIDVDESAIDVRMTNKQNDDGTNGAPALYANIPIISIKDDILREKNKKQDQKKEQEEKKEEQPKKEEAKQPEQKSEEKKSEEKKQEEKKQEENKKQTEEKNEPKKQEKNETVSKK